MGRYDFKTLSHQDFEELTRDLLQAEWNVALETFKAGRDQGVDVRYAPLDGGKTIVQCKHYASSSISKLLSDLRCHEVPKVKLLHPQRYVLVTSLHLSPTDKDKLVEVFQPFIVGTGDVIGADDMNGLLSRHPDIERANFKLWLTNTTVLNRVLHNAELSQTEFEVERIRRKLPVFVQSKALPRAQQLLNEHRIVIISGVPGIGKTTLAEILLYAHLDDGYQPVVIQTDVAEGKRLFRPQSKQVFYYDDFLGQTFLGDQRTYIGSNHDAALISFMEMVRSTPHSKFVLTTREHILSRAFQLSERLHHSAMLDQRCVLDLGDYSFGQRARILYNHLYFSDLPQAYKDAILEEDFFLEIIKHEHFNPRLIEWLVSLTRLQSPEPEQYKQRIASLLQSPKNLWSHAFETQISDAGRDLLLALYSLGNWVDVVDLEPAFESIHQGNTRRYNRLQRADDFRTALRELEGAFLTYHAGRAKFINPSIRDFAAGVICRTPAIAFDLMAEAIRFKQIANLWDLANVRDDQSLRSAIVADASRFRLQIERVLLGEPIRWEETLRGRVGYVIDTGMEARLAKLVEMCNSLRDHDFLSLCKTYGKELVIHWQRQGVDFHIALQTLTMMLDQAWYVSNGGKSMYREVLDGLLTHLEVAGAYDWLALLRFSETATEWTETDRAQINTALTTYRNQGVLEDIDNCSDASDLNDLQSSLNELSKQHGLDFSRAIARIDEAIAERSEGEPEEESSSHSENAAVEKAESITEEDVREMFQTLRE